MGKRAKEHRKKVEKRNAQIREKQSNYRKAHKEMLMKMIEEEKKKGLFDNLPQIPNLNMNGPDPLSDQQLII